MTMQVQIAIDCADPLRLAAFWAAVLGHEVDRDSDDGASAVSDPDRQHPRFYFQRVPEAKTVKNRVHVDLKVSGGDDEKLAAEHRRLAGLGASTRQRVEEGGQRWIVMQDPEGNEFCLS